MFKNYLTYSFAQSFHRLCLCVDLPQSSKHRLLRSAEQMIHQFTQSLHSKDTREEGRFLFSALLNLRDCQETLAENYLFTGEIETKYEMLQQRLEKICTEVAKQEGGQLRMLG